MVVVLEYNIVLFFALAMENNAILYCDLVHSGGFLDSGLFGFQYNIVLFFSTLEQYNIVFYPY